MIFNQDFVGAHLARQTPRDLSRLKALLRNKTAALAAVLQK